MSKEKKTAVDFSNPEALAEELAAIDVKPTAKAKAKKPAKPRVIKVTYVADKDYKAGDTIEFDYEVPKAKRRGAVAGIPVTEMTDDQLKIEYRNANSVLYKTTKAGRDTTKAQARVDAVVAIMDEKGIRPTARGAAAQKVDATTIANLIKAGTISVEDIQKLLDE